MGKRQIVFFTIIGLAVTLAGLWAIVTLVMVRWLGPPDLAATTMAIDRRTTEEAVNFRATEIGLLMLATDTALKAREAEIVATRAALTGATPTPAEVEPGDEAGQGNSAPNAAPGLTNTGDLTWNGLRIEVVNVNYNAWPLIKAQNGNNEPPFDDKTMLIVTIRVTNVEGAGDEYIAVRDSDFELVGNRKTIYQTFRASCGVTPDNLDTTLGLGDSDDGNICFQVPMDEADFELIYEPFDAPAIYFNLPGRSELDGFRPEARPVLVETQALTWNGLQIDIVALDDDAWPLLKAHNYLNDPPLEGMTPLLITLRVTNVEGLADEPIKLWDSDFKLTGSRNKVYETFEASCGVIPDLLNGVVERGSSMEGKICFQAPVAENGFKLIYEPAGSPAIYFALPERALPK
jgi:hypothetical protein